MRSRHLDPLYLPAVLLAVMLLLGGCNLPIDRAGGILTPTPWIIYITATPEGAGLPPPTETPLLVGPYQLTPVTIGPEPTLDLSGLTLTPAPLPSSPTPDLTITPSAATSTATPPLPAPTPTSLPPTAVPRPPAARLGINFISSAQHQTDEARFQAGLNAGAGWDRFAIYWSDIEQQPDTYVWVLYDEAVRNDVIHNLQTNAILLGVPAIYNDGRNVPVNLDQPVFIDGTDIPGPGKAINPNNPWADFVYTVVMRYKPGGTRARAEGWPAGQGVRVWEIWNEPDFSMFWNGSVQEYARLLKVAYLAAKQADPQAQVMLGGLVLFEKPAFLVDLLNIYKNDPAPVPARYPFDIVALHSYSHPPYTFYAVQRTENLLAVYGLADLPIWLNESGVAVWDDYPGPQWATRPDQIVMRATQQEQASYVIQSAAYAFMAGAEVVFHFQLYDDCGNQPRGTTFAPNDGSLCGSGAACWGDALGLLRNSSSNLCFNQHPQPGTARPAYSAFRTLSQVFSSADFVPLSGFTAGPRNGQQWLVFARPATSELITVIWDTMGQAGEAVIPARSTQATLITQDGQQTVIRPRESDAAYHVSLLPATNYNMSGVGAMIGGPPVIVIETIVRPVVSVLPLLERSRPAFLVKWQSSDPLVTQFQVWYRDETAGSDWTLWIETNTPGEALFAGGSGRQYSFFARGLAPDGQWTADTPVVQATTITE